MKSKILIRCVLLCLCLLFISGSGRGQNPELIAQLGHNSPVESFAFGLGGKVLITGASPGIRFWDSGNGAMLRSLPSATFVTVSFDGALICTVERRTLTIRDIETGAIRQTLIGVDVDPGSGPGLHVSSDNVVIPDQNELFCMTEGEGLLVWDLRSGTHRQRLADDDLDRWKTVEFSSTLSPDGKYLAVYYDLSLPANPNSSVQRIDLFDTSSGNLLYSRTAPVDYQYQNISFSRDGKILIGVQLHFDPANNKSKPQPSTFFWEAGTGATAFATLDGEQHCFFREGTRACAPSGEFTPDGSMIVKLADNGNPVVVDAVTLKPKYSLSSDLDQEFVSYVFSPDAKNIAINYGNTVDLWSLENGTRRFSVPNYDQNTARIAFSNNDKMMVASSESRTRVWDLSNGVMVANVEGRFKGFSANGALLATERAGPANRATTGLPDGTAPDSDVSETVIWNSGNSSMVHAFPGSFLALSRDGDQVMTDGPEVGIRLWDAGSGKALRTLIGGAVEFKAVAVSPDFAWVAVRRDGQHVIELTAIANEKITRALPITGLSKADWEQNREEEIVFSPDGKLLAYMSGEEWERHSVMIVETLSGRLVRSFKVTSGSGVHLRFNPAGTSLITDGNAIASWSISSGKSLRDFNIHPITSRTTEWESNTVISPNGKLLIGIGPEGSLLWNYQTGSEIDWYRLREASSAINCFSHDGKTLATVGGDGGINLWDVASGTPLLELLVLDRDDWLAVTPDDRFDGPPTAWSQAFWRFSAHLFDVAPVEAFFNEFYYPGLLADAVSRKLPVSPVTVAQKDRRSPQVKLSASAAPADGAIGARELSVKIDISAAPAGARDVRLFRNGSLIKMWHGDVLTGQDSVRLETTIPIVAGENRLTAYAFNHDNIKSSDANLLVTGANDLKRKGTVYLLAAGVDEYADHDYDLKYAVADARDFADEVKLQQEKLGRYARVEVVMLENQAATKANFLNALADLSAKTQPEDAVIIYFSGHGAAAGNRFYLIPYDLGYAGSRTELDSAGLQGILAHGVSDQELSRAVEGIDAGQMLLVIDACNSGQALEAREKRRGPMNSKGLAQMAYEKGMYILTAAQSYQAALEASKLGHGYLTYALVEEGLKTPAADTAPKDGQVLLREWLDYATNRVPQMQQTKIEEGRGRQLELVVEFANGEEQLDPSQRTVQRPRVFYRREVEPVPWIVSRP